MDKWGLWYTDLPLSPSLCLYPSPFQNSFCVPTKQTTSVQRATQSPPTSPTPVKILTWVNKERPLEAQLPPAGRRQGVGGKKHLRAHSSSPGAASLRPTKHTRTALPEKVPATGFLTVFNEGAMPHPHPTLATLSCNAPLCRRLLQTVGQAFRRHHQSLSF